MDSIQIMTDDQKKQAFYGLLDELQRNNCRLDEDFQLLADELARKKGKWEMPSFGELRSHFNSFMNQKRTTLRTYWSKHHVSVLLFLLSYFHRRFNITPTFFSDAHWHSLSNLLPSSTAECLKYKWLSLTLQHHKRLTPTYWSFKEDCLLSELVETFFPSLLEAKQSQRKVKWALLAMKLNHLSGHGLKLAKHCKERWLNHLSPFLNKGDWTEEEDILLMDNAVALRRKWTKVAEKFPGRTQHQVKNRFLSLVARENGVSTKQVDLKGKHDDVAVLKAVCGLKRRFAARTKIFPMFTEKEEGVKEEEFRFEEEKANEKHSFVDKIMGFSAEAGLSKEDDNIDFFSFKETDYTNCDDMYGLRENQEEIKEEKCLWKLLEESRNEYKEMMGEGVENGQISLDFFA